MVTTLLRLYLAWVTHWTPAHVDEAAHVVCENHVYAVVEPGLVSTDADPDPTTPAGEAWCEILCRDEPFLAVP